MRPSLELEQSERGWQPHRAVSTIEVISILPWYDALPPVLFVLILKSSHAIDFRKSRLNVATDLNGGDHVFVRGHIVIKYLRGESARSQHCQSALHCFETPAHLD